MVQTTRGPVAPGTARGAAGVLGPPDGIGAADAAHHLAHDVAFDGTLHLIFQPAEEGQGGGRKMIEGTPGDIMAGTETDSLGEAFSRLTGAADIQSQARGILDAIGGPQP